MLRLLGAALLAGGAAVLGFSAAGQLSKRVNSLRAMLAALELMERELAFSLTPMPELLTHLAARTQPPVDGFFAHCLSGMDALGEKCLGQLWREALAGTNLGLGVRETATLAELGDVLGRYDGEGQQAALARARGQLGEDLKRAEDAREKQGRMYGVLGLTAGAFLVILLL